MTYSQYNHTRPYWMKVRDWRGRPGDHEAGAVLRTGNMQEGYRLYFCFSKYEGALQLSQPYIRQLVRLHLLPCEFMAVEYHMPRGG